MCEVNMQDIILLKQGEIVLKGLNKKYFEQKLISNVKRRLRSLGEFDVTCTQSTIYVEPKSDDIDMDETQQAMTKVFGIAAVVRAAACDKTPEAMAQKAIEYMAEAMREAGSFKVETRRADKAFPMTSPADYGIKELEGQAVELDVEVVEVAEPAYPEVDDEFAASLGVKGGVEAMRAEIRANLEREVKARLETKTKAEVMEAAANACDFALPTVLVNDQCEALRQQMESDLAGRGIDVKKMPAMPVDAFKPQAERRVRLGLFVEALISQENISGSDEQVREIAADIASSYEKPEEVIEYIMKDQNRVGNLRAQATENNVTEWILAKAKTVEETVEFDKLMAGQF